MIKPMRSSDRRRVGQSGQAMVEFALLMPFLMLMIFAIIEFGRGIDAKHSIATLTREGAMLAARGTSLDSVARAVVDNGVDIRLSTNGGSIASEVEVTGNGPVLRAQVKSPGFTTASRMGAVGDTVTSLKGLGLLTGTRVFVVEVFYNHVPLVPLGRFTSSTVPTTLYERAVF